MAKIAPARTKRSKAEVQKEFSKIVEESAQEKEAATPKADELQKAREAETRSAVEEISVVGVVQRISGLGLEVSKALSGVREQLVHEVERLDTIREAVALESKELERLHKIDVAATALDQLILDYQTQEQELKTDIESQRADWAEEEQQRAREQKDYDESLKKQRQRETEEYEYKKALERKKAQDKYEEDLRLQEKKNKERQEALEKGWQQRDAALKEKEEEWARLKKEVEGFPDRLKHEIDEAVARAVKATEQSLEQQILLSKKDAEAEKRVAELQIKALQDTVARQTAEIEALHKQLDEAKRQVQDIAVKAIEGASGAKALAHVNQIAIEQAKTRSPQN